MKGPRLPPRGLCSGPAVSFPPGTRAPGVGRVYDGGVIVDYPLSQGPWPASTQPEPPLRGGPWFGAPTRLTHAWQPSREVGSAVAVPIS